MVGFFRHSGKCKSHAIPPPAVINRKYCDRGQAEDADYDADDPFVLMDRRH